MLHFTPTKQFNKDMKTVAKRGLDLDLLDRVIERLLAGDRLPKKYRDHALVANYRGHRECHIMPDWLLIYRVDGDNFIATHTGSHSDLF
jgi:mRNA interferase YafQ